MTAVGGGLALPPVADVDDPAAIEAWYTELQNAKLTETLDRDYRSFWRTETSLEIKFGQDHARKFDL